MENKAFEDFIENKKDGDTRTAHPTMSEIDNLLYIETLARQSK